MSEERKPVICPWCGYEMSLMSVSDEPYERWYKCYNCEARSPIALTDEAAYAAATRRPPNRPLTLPELFDLEDDDAAWVVAENGKIYAMGAECAQEWAGEEHCLFFAVKPTPADIEAARKERNG